MAVHREAPYRDARRVGALAATEQADAQTLVIPLYPDLSEEDQDYVIRELLAALGELPT
jgi:dTDP-4-amino-4,6-dideoxygalactose transaminase